MTDRTLTRKPSVPKLASRRLLQQVDVTSPRGGICLSEEGVRQ
jgi:hypothetical protein